MQHPRGGRDQRRRRVDCWKGQAGRALAHHHPLVHPEDGLPYGLWIRSLKLGNLGELLKDIAQNPQLRDTFFSDDMAAFSIVGMNRHNRPVLQVDAIAIKVGDTITTFVKDAADRDNKSGRPDQPRGRGHPHRRPPCVAVEALSTLASLAIQDGSVLSPALATAIRDHCPGFKEVECYYCNGPTADVDLAGFFKTLPPNSLEAFSIQSLNQLGEHAFEALATHSQSLRTLRLATLQSTAFRHLGQLRRCTGLRSLTLEAGYDVNLSWETEHKDSFLEVITWIKDCRSLATLQLFRVPSGSTLLGHVLRAPTVRLTQLDMKLYDDDEAWYTSVANQTSLQSLSLRGHDQLLELPPAILTTFVQSLMACRALTKLDIMQTIVTLEDLTAMSESLVYLEDLSFDGDDFRDDIFEPLFQMQHLKTLGIHGGSFFTFDGILNFVQRLSACSRARSGFTLHIMNQQSHCKLTTEEEEYIRQQMASSLAGKFDIQYLGGYLDDLLESDLSD